MTTKLEDASKLMKELEKDRAEKFGELAEQLKKTGEQTTRLTETTVTLREALSSTKARGQWGERMAEDVLRLAGLIENVNYVKQKAIEEGQARPDFTFLLPNHMKLNMDVKFPLDNYMKFLEALGDKRLRSTQNDSMSIKELLPASKKRYTKLKDYSGFKNYCYLSSGIVRDFVTLVKDTIYRAYPKIAYKKVKLAPISPKIQNEVIDKVTKIRIS